MIPPGLLGYRLVRSKFLDMIPQRDLILQAIPANYKLFSLICLNRSSDLIPLFRPFQCEVSVPPINFISLASSGDNSAPTIRGVLPFTAPSIPENRISQ